MKVAVVAPTSIPSKKANTVQVMKMIQAIATIGHKVLVLIPGSQDSTKKTNPSWEALADHYGLVRQFPMEWIPTRNLFRKYDFAWEAVNKAGIWKADILYTRLPQAAALAANRKLNTIFELHDMPRGTLGPVLARLFLNGRSAQKLIVITHALVRDLEQTSYITQASGQIEVLPDGVDLGRYEGLPGPQASRQLLAPIIESEYLENGSQFFPDRVTIGYTGHLYPGRGMNLILDIAERIPEANFLIVGGEPDDVRGWQEEARIRNLANIFLTGFIPNAELPKFQAACDVLLMPYQTKVSASSGGDIGKYLSPMKLFEYLACGRAICSSNLPVLKEILSPETAVLLPPDDLNAWAASIENLINNPELRRELGTKAKNHAKSFSWERRAERLFEGIQPSK